MLDNWICEVEEAVGFELSLKLAWLVACGDDVCPGKMFTFSRDWLDIGNISSLSVDLLFANS